ncbi:GntR family transcriptional regulator [Mesorhizobium sp. ASY16-5R]|uniref:GntR family transcriptional regulator n=1 Tax=Mesorhizobium sp. ASY16-5R TaxID=3445772 RepID=UPI003F9F65ED
MKLREQAYDAFTQHLLERKLMPGQLLSQRELAEMTSMSLGAIREMIPRLEAEGLVTTIAQRGLQVADIDLKMIHDSFTVREIVETAALRHYIATASDRAIAAFETEIEDFKTRARHGMSAQLLAEAQKADWKFHDALVKAMDNRIMWEIHRVNSIRIRMVLGARIGLSANRLPIALDEHLKIIKAMRQRDVEASVAALHDHLASSRQRALMADFTTD